MLWSKRSTSGIQPSGGRDVEGAAEQVWEGSAQIALGIIGFQDGLLWLRCHRTRQMRLGAVSSYVSGVV